jgi:hypothetical protein
MPETSKHLGFQEKETNSGVVAAPFPSVFKEGNELASTAFSTEDSTASETWRQEIECQSTTLPHAVKTRIGSTRVARRAGNAHAETATAASPIIAAPMIHGLVEWIP